MNHADIYQLRETYNEQRIVLCFNGPFSHGLIVEIGNALKRYMQTESVSSSSAMDVFAAYIEMTQNIQQYALARGYSDKNASATVVISRDGEGRYEIIAGNIAEPEDSDLLAQRIEALSKMDKQELKSA
jgi:hypothetical protein